MALNMRAVAHQTEGAVREVPLADIDILLRDEHALLWLDVEAPGPEAADLLKEDFGFHELALEDALRGGQRPKVDEYAHY